VNDAKVCDWNHTSDDANSDDRSKAKGLGWFQVVDDNSSLERSICDCATRVGMDKVKESPCPRMG
jgi:hypothetical protein